ncbi:uncharacterized protein LOC110116388 [Dendrobium catenatum]|uniref:uncharacterized protein LOC110116388 n=1 Tax=Dendrobium catenatum TaxID=906689 RepID=UPI0009F1FB2E|nr:uncharacterized protein LOC110116388 [Dendrobium catenatum]
MEAVLNNGPWLVNDSIIGLDKWSLDFNPSSLNGLTAPVWIRLLNLPLQSWDIINVCRIASKVGVPFLIDENMFQWGRREYARICIRIKLEGKLPLGVWVEGAFGKFYQKVCYEKFPFICFKYGRIVHLEKVYLVSKEEPVQIFNEDVARSVEGDIAIMRKNSKADSVEKDVFKATNDDYGPWLHVNYGRKRGKNFRIQNNWSRQTISVKKDKKVTKEVHSEVDIVWDQSKTEE